MRINQLKIFVILLVCLVTLPLLSESASKVKAFVKKVEGGGRVIDVIQTTDGNYVSISSNEERAQNGTVSTNIVRKVTVLGKSIWERELSGWSKPTRLVGIVQTNDEYVLVGYNLISGYYGPNTGIMVALRSDGEVIWKKSFSVAGGDIYF